MFYSSMFKMMKRSPPDSSHRRTASPTDRVTCSGFSCPAFLSPGTQSLPCSMGKVAGGRGGPAFETPQRRPQCRMTRSHVSGFSSSLPEATLHTPVRSDLSSGPAPPMPTHTLFGRRSSLRCYRVILLRSWSPGKQSHGTGLFFPLFSLLPPAATDVGGPLAALPLPTSSLCPYPNQLSAQMMPRSTGL